MFRYGLVGTGAIAADLCTALAGDPGVAIVNVVGSDPDKAATFAERHRLPRAAATLADLLADPQLDAIHIATPHVHHAEVAQAALAAGRAVLCEKPMTTSADTTRRLIASAEAHGVMLAEAWMYRLHPQIDTVRALLADGAIGSLRHVSARFGFRAPRRPGQRLFAPALGGGAILDVGGYPLSFVRWLVAAARGCAPADAAATAQRFHGVGVIGPTGVDERALALLDHGAGLTADLACAIHDALGSGATLYGTAGRIELDDPWLPGGQRQGLNAGLTLHRDGQSPETITVTAKAPVYALQARRFADAVQHGDSARWPVSPAESIAIADDLARWRAALA